MGTILPSIQVPSVLWGIIQSILIVWGVVWWIVLPIIAIIVFWEAWLLHLHYNFVTSIKWKMLEIKVPKTVLKTPKAMEQIFAAAHAPYSYGISHITNIGKGRRNIGWSSSSSAVPARRIFIFVCHRNSAT